MHPNRLPKTVGDHLFERANQDSKLVIIAAQTDGFVPKDPGADLGKKGQYYCRPVCDAGLIALAAQKAAAGATCFVLAPAGRIVSGCIEAIVAQLLVPSLPVTLVGIRPGNVISPALAVVENMDLAVLRAVPAISIFSAADDLSGAAIIDAIIKTPRLTYIRTGPEPLPKLYGASDRLALAEGMGHIRQGRDLCVVATGKMVHRALELADALTTRNIDTGVVDLFRLKPLNRDRLYAILSRYTYLASLEEHSICGGIGSAMLETLSENGKTHSVLRFGIDAATGPDPADSRAKKKPLDLENLIKKIAEKIW